MSDVRVTGSEVVVAMAGLKVTVVVVIQPTRVNQSDRQVIKEEESVIHSYSVKAYRQYPANSWLGSCVANLSTWRSCSGITWRDIYQWRQ